MQDSWIRATRHGVAHLVDVHPTTLYEPAITRCGLVVRRTNTTRLTRNPGHLARCQRCEKYRQKEAV